MTGGDPFAWLPGRLAIAGVQVGVWQDARARTGVTALILPEGTAGGVDAAGGAPATRETDLLRPDNLVRGPDAIVFTGGSAPGLAAADGVVAHLQAQGRGVRVGTVRVPIVVAAALFDLTVGEPRSPGPAEGAAAAHAARPGEAGVPEGPAGAGAGATVAKLSGAGRPAGQGAVTVCAPDGLRVGALAVVNAVGSVIGPDGQVLVGEQAADGTPLDPLAAWADGEPGAPSGRAHTTLVAVVTDAALDKAALRRVARMAHDGLARALEPVHTLWDGDIVVALATGSAPPADASRVGALAARAVAVAIRRSVRTAPG